MSLLHAVVISILAAVACAQRAFPAGFKFGAATAAYQVEGGWNASDKGESIWDRFVHTRPESISDLSNGDVACDSYHLWRDDVQLARDLGLDFYRFSISWSRVLPSGFTNHISEAGARYYSDLIDELLQHGIQPAVTLYHWDLPQTLQDLGGWTNPLIVEWFTDYARVMYDLYGDRVQTWMTINEPIVVCDLSYTGLLAPGIRDPEIGALLCNKHVLLAHAAAYRLYDEEYKPKYHGEVSLANQLFWLEPVSEDDEAITALARDNFIGRYSHPIYSKEGGWPPVLEKFMAEKSQKEGFFQSRLPAFTQEEVEFIRGTYDFYALNHYTSRVVRKPKEGEEIGAFPLFGDEVVGAVFEGREEWDQATSSWFLVNPKGLRDQMIWLKEQYGDLKILITENGYSDTGSELDDVQRVQYYRDYLEQVLLAIEEGVNVVGYTAWSLMDNFEWWDGYQSRFGLYHVDFSSSLRTRTPRSSAHYYRRLLAARALIEPEYNTIA